MSAGGGLQSRRWLWVAAGLVSQVYWLPGVSPQIATAVRGLVWLIAIASLVPVGFMRLPNIGGVFIWYGALLAVGALLSWPIFTPNIAAVGSYMLIPASVVLFLSSRAGDSAARDFLVGSIAASIVSSLYIVYGSAVGSNDAPIELVGARAFFPYATMGFSYSHTVAAPVLGAAALLVWFSAQSIWMKLLLTALLATGQCLTTGEVGIVSALAGAIYAYSPYKLRLTTIILPPVIFSTLFLSSNYSIFLDTGAFSTTLIERMASIQFAVQAFWEHPLLGLGLGNSAQGFHSGVARSDFGDLVHGDELQPHASAFLLIAEAGIFGVIASVLLYGALLQALLRFKGQSHQMGLAAVTFQFYCVSFFEPWPFVTNFFASAVPICALVLLNVGRTVGRYDGEWSTVRTKQVYR